MSRIGGFPRFKRPDHKPAPVVPVAAAPTAVEQRDEQQAKPSTRFPRLPTWPATSPRPPGIWVPIPAEPAALMPVAEPEFDEEGRRIITTPLAPPPRRSGVMWQPTPAIDRTPAPAAPPTRLPGAGLMAPPPPLSPPLPRLSMNDAGKFPLRPITKPQQPVPASTQKPTLTADDIPF